MKTLMIKKIFLILSLILCSFSVSVPVLAQSQTSDIHKQIEEIMKAREEMFRSLLDDNSFEEFDKRFEQMMKKFDQHGGFGLQQFDDPIVGEYDWIKTSTHKILKLKVKQVKDKPLDIKIEGGMIRLKGDVETVEGEGQNSIRRKVSFQRAFTLPDDVDQTNPEFENKDGAMLIKFKLKKASANSKTPQEINDRVPLTPEKDAINI